MDKAYQHFYRNFYVRTGNFIPSKPLSQCVFPGDFFQIRNGELIVLGNIFRGGIVDRGNVEFSYGNRLNPAGWFFSEGVTKPYSARGTGEGPISGGFEFSKQVLAFAHKGDFIFRGNYPESVKIVNWSDIQQQLIIKLTQTFYSFREVYVVTETATMSHWTLAIAGADKAELEIATEDNNFGLVDIFGFESAKTIQSKDIEFYHRESGRKPVFFKAKKLVVQDDKMEIFISELISQATGKTDWAGSFFDYEFNLENDYFPASHGHARDNVLDMLQANQLNPNTALQYFKWSDANLEDIEKLFLPNGYN